MWLNVLVLALVWAHISAFEQFVEARCLSRSADWSMFWQFRGSIPEASQKFCLFQKFLSRIYWCPGARVEGWSDQSLKLSSHLHLVPWIGMATDVPHTILFNYKEPYLTGFEVRIPKPCNVDLWVMTP